MGDEPTNGLAEGTLHVLQGLLADDDGTVLLVSHDRDFLDRTVNMTVALEGDGQATLYAGGWSDYHSQRKPEISLSSPLKRKRLKAHHKVLIRIKKIPYLL